MIQHKAESDQVLSESLQIVDLKYCTNHSGVTYNPTRLVSFVRDTSRHDKSP